jgi:hypothetical protein
MQYLLRERWFLCLGLQMMMGLGHGRQRSAL